jgi:hypothetical protein
VLFVVVVALAASVAVGFKELGLAVVGGTAARATPLRGTCPQW